MRLAGLKKTKESFRTVPFWSLLGLCGEFPRSRHFHCPAGCALPLTALPSPHCPSLGELSSSSSTTPDVQSFTQIYCLGFEKGFTAFPSVFTLSAGEISPPSRSVPYQGNTAQRGCRQEGRAKRFRRRAPLGAVLRARPGAETPAGLPAAPGCAARQRGCPGATAGRSALRAGPPARPARPARSAGRCSQRLIQRKQRRTETPDVPLKGLRHPAGQLGLEVLGRPILSDLQGSPLGEILSRRTLSPRAGLAGAGAQPFLPARAACGRTDRARLQPGFVASLSRARPTRPHCTATARPRDDFPGGSTDGVSCT